jgi:hypothetical protein
MIFNKKNLKTFALFLVCGLILGSLMWEVLERLLQQFGFNLSLTTEQPLFMLDVYVISLSLRFNLGSLLGALGGTVFFALI